MSKRIFHSDRAFLDLLFNCLLGFVLLFMVSFMMIEIEKRKANITTKAEFVATLTWDLGCSDDVDIWLRDPMGKILFFQEKEKGVMHLDRDDLGSTKDKVFLPDGAEVYYPYNQEIVTIRGAISGMWILNIHMYKKKELGAANVEVKLEKLNPRVSLIFCKSYVMEEEKEEITVARFEMDSTGTILHVDEVQVGLVREKLVERGLGGSD